MSLRDDEIGKKIAPFLSPGMRLIDIGAGTGRIASWLAGRVGVHPTLADVTEFGNRSRRHPYIRMEDPLRVPVGDASFDAVLLLFVLHHIERWEHQEALVREAVRVTRRRLIVIEDTPMSRVDRAFNVAWDWLLNLRHGVPTPFTFRSVGGWREVFDRAGLHVRAARSYRPMWPTLMTYHHTLFVLDRRDDLGDAQPTDPR